MAITVAAMNKVFNDNDTGLECKSYCGYVVFTGTRPDVVVPEDLPLRVLWHIDAERALAYAKGETTLDNI